MIRHLAYLAPLALLGLAACNGPAQLTKAKEGECFTVVGREPGGAPKLEKTECLTSAQPDLAPTTASDQVATADGAKTSALCPTSPLVCPTTARRAPARVERHASRHRRSGRRASQETRRTQAVDRTTVVQQNDYARVYTPDYPQPDLLGAAPQAYREDRYQYSYRHKAEPTLPPAPPVERYERREGHAYGERSYGRREESRRREHYSHREHHAAPPPPPAMAPPPVPPPPPAYVEGHGSRHAEQSRQYGYSETYSSHQRSSASSSSSGTYGQGYHCPERCPPRGAPVMAPMNGPHFPVDSNGYLTWRGKTPQPQLQTQPQSQP